ncbi:hypothetical protein PR048_011417 [Dryococelus australis]|uniref:Uncharacterized protein n=1 Tax=Dryococelus australis TaxID=614101 RepID=A0ABQ9HLI5_9NEOP|nr:hypothetical protein PR048_011417 [Dryococelus australis]
MLKPSFGPQEEARASERVALKEYQGRGSQADHSNCSRADFSSRADYSRGNGVPKKPKSSQRKLSQQQVSQQQSTSRTTATPKHPPLGNLVVLTKGVQQATEQSGSDPQGLVRTGSVAAKGSIQAGRVRTGANIPVSDLIPGDTPSVGLVPLHSEGPWDEALPGKRGKNRNHEERRKKIDNKKTPQLTSEEKSSRKQDRIEEHQINPAETFRHHSKCCEQRKKCVKCARNHHSNLCPRNIDTSIPIKCENCEESHSAGDRNVGYGKKK